MSEGADREHSESQGDRFAQLWRRIHDHKMVQWTVAYVALAYGIQHGVTARKASNNERRSSTLSGP
jgi:hypothetical protein